MESAGLGDEKFSKAGDATAAAFDTEAGGGSSNRPRLHGDLASRPRPKVLPPRENFKLVGCFVAGLLCLGTVIYYAAGGLDSSYEIPPKEPLPNDENRSVYFGYGCFWHAQYDLYEVEHNEFSRSDAEITSLVGYAGGLYTSEDGLVCYHGGPSGSEYGDDGHAEVVQVQLDVGREAAQYTQLLAKFFGEGFVCDGSDCTRKDPQDYGAAYRNVIGLPGGMQGKLWHLVAPANVNSMELQAGGDGGGRGDDEDEGVVYVYDSLKYHFYRGEAYHQFHANTVLHRPVGEEYIRDLKATQRALGRIDPTGCPEGGIGF